jgi:uncharacterized protein (DUF2235 family)
MPKNIVICLDGTGNQLKANANSNVLHLYSMLDLGDPGRQVGYYDPGVGTMGASGAWSTWGRKLTRLLGLAFGSGIKDNLGEALGFLIRNYVPGDRVYIFGFSRGAFTARGLVGMTYRSGVMRAGTENLVPYLVAAYTKGSAFSKDDWVKLDRFASTFSVVTDRSRALPVHFLGLWDSVKALGILRPDPKWPYTRQLPNARHVFHAVSIDERRRPYREYLIKPSKALASKETWFAGVHSDIGGGFRDHPELSRITLKWMTDRALDHGLILAPGAYQRLCAVVPGDALGVAHPNGWIWGLFTFRRRPIETGHPLVHASVRARIEADPGYRLPIDAAEVTWDDADWLNPHPGAPGADGAVDEPVNALEEPSP